MNKNNIIDYIKSGKAALGIELGSTRIKAVLTGEDYTPIAIGSYEWENRFENGIWTYNLEDALNGLRKCYSSMISDVKSKYNVEVTKLAAIGFSAMMHGYLVFDKDGKLLTPFRTWRNTITEDSAAELTELFGFNIPQRWSVAHLYKEIKNDSPHVKQIAYMTTLSGYIHHMLTGQKVLGIGDASGMFPINHDTNDYDENMLNIFDEITKQKGYNWNLKSILPKVLVAGEDAGKLTSEGIKLLDESGILCEGIPVAPPEGDAATGMVATNSIAPRTGNVSAGTSIFAMFVLENPLKNLHPEADIVTTPTGKPVAMVHCNNCTSDINEWAHVLKEFCETVGCSVDMPQIFNSIFLSALKGDRDCGGLLSYNYLSGEHITEVSNGIPLFMRFANADFTFANFARTQVFSTLATLRIGTDILRNEEDVKIDSLYGHGGFFKSKPTGQKLMAAALDTPVSVMETAGEGGAWGMAILADYMINKSNGQTLEEFLSTKVFAFSESETLKPEEDDKKGFNEFMKNYIKALDIERAASKL